MKMAALFVSLLVPLAASLAAADEPWKHSMFPADIEINLGGLSPVGKTSESFSKAFGIGGNFSFPITRYFQADALSFEFGRGTLGPPRNILVQDNTSRKVNNYTALLAFGGRAVVPLSRSGTELGLGGGYSIAGYNEYAQGQTRYVGRQALRGCDSA